MDNQIKTIKILLSVCIWSLVALLYAGEMWAKENHPFTIELTQTGCQFLEPEGVDHQFQTAKAADCKKINKKSGKERLKKVKPLRLKPGKYTFRITNKNVSYPLGFWLRGAGFKRFSLPKVSGGGLAMGKTKDFQIDLKPGKYLYSCPLNPTPDYPLVVEK